MPRAADPDVIGLVIGGRFELKRLLGVGGMGSVYEAEHTTLERRFAVKILKPELARDRRFVERFRREAIASSRVDHPNVAQIIDFGQLESGEFYLVMEYLEGEGIDAVLRRQGRLRLARAIPILAQIADGLEYAHRSRIVHRDLKPENVLLTTVREQADFVKLLDFGIAKIQTQSLSGRLTLQGQIFGTAEYVSPEQAMDREVDGRSDLYSVGVLAFEMVTGTVPFEGGAADVLQSHVVKPPPAPSTRVPRGELPAFFDAIVLRLLAKDPDDRYQSGAQLRRELLRLRGLMAAAADGLLDGTGRKRLRRSILDTGGWRTLGSRTSSYAVRDVPAAVMHELSGPTRATSETGEQEPWRSSRDVRRRLHKTLRRLAMALAEAAFDTAAIRNALREALVIEEESAALGNEIALLEQNFERIRFEVGERETDFRHAIVDLGLERDRRGGQATPAELADLEYQIGELQKRLAEVSADRQRRTRDLVAEVGRLKGEREARERAAAECYQTLEAIVERARGRVSGEEYARLFSDYDELRERLSQMRATLPPL